MIAFAIISLIIGAVLLAISSPRKGGELKVGVENLQTTLPEITGLAKIPAFILGLILIGIGLWMGISLFIQSVNEPSITQSIVTQQPPTVVPPTSIDKPALPTDTPMSPTTIPASPTNVPLPPTNTPAPQPTNISTPEPTTATPTSLTTVTVLPLETIPMTIQRYDSPHNVSPLIPEKEGSVTSYSLRYTFLEQGDSFAGIDFIFDQPLDISEYKVIELTIEFDDGQSRCKLIIEDSFDGIGDFLLGDGKLVDPTPGKHYVTVPLYQFAIDFSAVRLITFDANVDYGFRGSHGFTVSNIRFSK